MRRPILIAVASLLALGAAAPVTAAVQSDQPQTYLVSVVDIPLNAGESIEAFSLSTWGVTVNAVCRIPPGWEVRAGGGLTPEGVLAGEGSHGASWFRESSPPALQAFTLITLNGPVRAQAARAPDGGGETPATFAGLATISTGDGDRQVRLTTSNVRLKSADRCPEG